MEYSWEQYLDEVEKAMGRPMTESESDGVRPVFDALKPIMDVSAFQPLVKCKDCCLYKCDSIRKLEEDWGTFCKIWYEHGCRCGDFKPKAVRLFIE